MIVISKKLSSDKLILLAGLAELGNEYLLSKVIIEYDTSKASLLEQPTDFQGVSVRGNACMVGKYKSSSWQHGMDGR